MPNRNGQKDDVGVYPWGPNENDSLKVNGLGKHDNIKHDPNAKTNLARDGYAAGGRLTDNREFEDFPSFNVPGPASMDS